VLQAGINDGRLRALAYTAMQEGEVPAHMTFTAAGLPELENVDSLNVLLGPKGMPPAIVAKLESAMKRVLEMPDIKAAFSSQKQYAPPMTAQQLGTRMSADMSHYRKLIKDANIRIVG
jgi:tripartite-type tricarboxylate transporter receptor subunit TctC